MGRVDHLVRGMNMKPSRFTEEQIGIFREHEAGVKTAELCRKHGMTV
jgi:putative transposase